MNNKVFDKIIRIKMSFWDERGIFRLMNNSVYCKTTKKKINARKNMRHIKMNFEMKKKQKGCFENFHFIIHSLKNQVLNI